MTKLTDIKLTANEKLILNAMLPHQCSDFIPNGMSNIETIQNWVAHTGHDMTTRSITGIVGSLTKKGLLFSEIMEESNGKMIYFSYEYFDQKPENLDILEAIVNDQPVPVKPAPVKTKKTTNTDWDNIKKITTDSCAIAGITDENAIKVICKIVRKETSCVRILITRKRKIESVAKKYNTDKYNALKNQMQTSFADDWAKYCEHAQLNIDYTLLDVLTHVMSMKTTTK